MTEKLKRLYLGLIALGVAALTLVSTYLNELDAPGPSPSPSPTASSSPSPTALPSPAPTVAAQIKGMTLALVKPEPPSYTLETTRTPSVTVMTGETTARIVELNSGTACGSVTAPAGVKASLFKMLTVTTTKKSHTLAVVGDHYDPVVPVSTVCQSDRFALVDITGVSAGTYQIQLLDLPVTVKVLPQVMPKPSMPLYIGLGSWALVLGHKLPTTTAVDVQGPLTMAYVNMLREHRIEPFAQFIVQPNGNLDNWKEWTGSFRQLAMTGALAAPMIAGPAFIGQPWLTAAQLAQWQALLQTEPGLAGAWAYVTDEVPDADLPGLKTRLQMARANAPGIKLMVTREPVADMLPLVDHWVPIFEYFKRADRWQNYDGMAYWMYGACPSHGSCSNGTLGTLTGTPDLMLDEPTHHAIAYPLVAYKMGAKAALYYTAVEAYGRMDPWLDQYQFGGNGDGQLVYPGRPGERGFTAHVPVASIRLKALREGMNLIEHAKLSGKNLVTNQFVWPKDVKAYDGMRLQ